MDRRLLAALLLLPAPAFAAEELSPRITVSGEASVSTPPDIATIQYVVHGEGTTSDEAVKALADRRRAIDQGLATIGPVQPQAGEVAVFDVRGRDCFGQNGNNRPRLATGECAIVGYVANLSVEIRTGRVKDAGTMVGLIGRLGGSNPRVSGFALTDNEEPKRRAMAAALANARRDAEAMAAGAGVKLGPLLGASDGSYTSIVVTGARISEFAPPPPPPPAPPPIDLPLAPRPIETQARVTVSYAILP